MLLTYINTNYFTLFNHSAENKEQMFVFLCQCSVYRHLRCRVGENWWYRGEHCEEYVSEPLVVGIAITSVAGFLLVASGVIFFLARTLRDQYDKDELEDPIRCVISLEYHMFKHYRDDP